MILITQLNALQPEVKLLLPGTKIHCSILQQQLRSTDPQQAPLNIGWRMIDRSQSAASPDCFVVTDASEQEEFAVLQPISHLHGNTAYAFNEFCLNTGGYQLTGIEQVTILLDIDVVL